MSYINNSRIFYLDTHDRISGEHENCTLKVEIPPTESFDRVCVLSCVIPRSYYLVEAPYNTFILRENGVDTTITIAEGNYNFSSFKAYLQNLLTTSSSQGWIYTITTPNTISQPSTGKYTFTVNTGGFMLNPSFIMPANTKVHEQLGFEPNSTNNFVGWSLTSRNVVKFILEDTLYIHSDIVGSIDNDILQEVFTSGSTDFSSIKFQNNTPQEYSKPLSTGNNNVYRFTLTDEDGNTIKLNGHNIVITLMIYKKNDLDKMQKEYIKYQLLKK